MRLALSGSLAVVLLGCEPVLSAETVKVVQLPADVMTGPARAGVQTKEGKIFAAPLTGGLLRLAADGDTWEELGAPAMQRFLPDFKEGLSIAQGEGSTGLFRASGDGFVALEPAVPALSNAAFGTSGFSNVLGRDARGVLWASATPTFAAMDAKVTLARFDGDWQYDEVPITFMRQMASLRPAMTSDARFFFRPDQSGLWEIDLPNHVLVERVKCDHELFRASSEAFMPCQEDTYVFAGRDGELFLLNPNRELWRITARGTIPSLVVKSALPKLETGEGRAAFGASVVNVDPKGRVWLGFRWGTNVDADTSWLYVADPAKGDAWIFLKRDLPRTIALFGDGDAPLISSTSTNGGLLIYRVLQ